LRHGRARHGHPLDGRVLSFDRPGPSPRWRTGHPAVRRGCRLRAVYGHWVRVAPGARDRLRLLDEPTNAHSSGRRRAIASRLHAAPDFAA
jgi:hypothetical protein